MGTVLNDMDRRGSSQHRVIYVFLEMCSVQQVVYHTVIFHLFGHCDGRSAASFGKLLVALEYDVGCGRFLLGTAKLVQLRLGEEN